MWCSLCPHFNNLHGIALTILCQFLSTALFPACLFPSMLPFPFPEVAPLITFFNMRNKTKGICLVNKSSTTHLCFPSPESFFQQSLPVTCFLKNCLKKCHCTLLERIHWYKILDSYLSLSALKQIRLSDICYAQVDYQSHSVLEHVFLPFRSSLASLLWTDLYLFLLVLRLCYQAFLWFFFLFWFYMLCEEEGQGKPMSQVGLKVKTPRAIGS